MTAISIIVSIDKQVGFKYMNSFEKCFINNEKILMEAALGERLKREYSIKAADDVALASIIYNTENKFVLKKLYSEYLEIAKRYKLPIMITTPTRRANKERVSNSKYDKDIIKDNVDFLKEIKEEFANDIYIGGLMGCAGDAYKSNEGLSIKDAVEFHSWQAELFKQSAVDFLFAGIMPTLPEAIGMAEAMGNTGLPYIISFMIREDGRLIDGTTIHDAIKIIDKSVTTVPLCYMSNCVHPEIVYKALDKEFNRTEKVRNRFKGIQANAAELSPEELDNSSELKISDPVSLAEEIEKLHKDFCLKIYGGCCGTDDKYLNEIAKKMTKW